MKKSTFLRKLLSAVCCVAMLVTMLPILPAAAADDVFFADDFSKHTVGAFDAAANGYKMTKASGSPVVNIEKDGTNQFMTITGARPYIEMGTPEGAFTLQVDVRRNASASGLFEIWMGDLGSGKTIRFRVHDNGAFGFVDTNTSKNYLVQNDGGFSAGGYNASRNDSSNALMSANTWYHVEFIADPDANTVKLTARERDDSSATVYEAERTMPDFGNYVLRMDGQDMSDGGKINVSVDNIKVVKGAVETNLPSTPAAPGGTAISGGSLNNFSDAGEITYTKAAEVTAGLGLFAGADGKFMPKSNVTRAQMATIIVKMLYGSDVNADSFKGTGKFTDTASFEGGWAEGYINWCSTLGIVAGYGDGTFRPGSNVTTAEAATMILNALKVDAGEGTWPHTVMAKAEELDMFEELSPKPANDKALTREELAVMALVGLEYSPEGATGYEYNGVVYDSYFDALLVAGDASKITPAAKDTLASKVFDMKTLEGYITGNQATGLEYTEINGAVPFAIETGLEHIGHFVTVYYAKEYESEDEPGLTYTIYDETKVYQVEDEDLDTAKEYKALFGKSYRLNSDGIALFNGQYEMTESGADAIDGYVAGSYAPMGTYLVNAGSIVAYMEPVPVYAAKVLAVNNYEGNESIELSSKKAPISNAENDDCIMEYKGIAKDDYVTYTMVGSGANAIYVLTKAKTVTGAVTKLSTDENGNRVATVKGNEYVAFGTDNNTTDLNTGDVSDFNATYVFYVTEDGKYLGWKTDTGSASLAEAVFILGELTLDQADSYGKTVRTVYARGVDMDGNEALIPVKVIKGEYNKTNKDFDSISETITDPNCAAVAANTFYYVKDATDKDAKKEGLSVLSAITSEYDEETMPIYYGTYATAANGTFYDNEMIINGVYSYKKSSTVYITLDGDVNQSTPLTATVKKGSMSATANTTGQSITRHILLSKTTTGGVAIEAVVLLVPSAEILMGGETVYIAEQALDNVSRSADGYVYDVYAYDTAGKKQITVEALLDESDIWAGSGFYQVNPVSGTECVELVKKIPHAADNYPDANSTADGLHYEEVYYDQVLFDINSDKFNTLPLASFGTTPTGTTSYGLRLGKKPSGAVVVDLRSENEITADGVGKIDSMDRINNLTLNDEELVILFDLCYSTNSDKLLTVFVKDVYYAAVNGIDLTVEGGKYNLNGYVVADNCVVSGQGVTSVGEIYDMLNPADAAPGYPPNEPANVSLEYAVTNGQITSIEVTKILRAGVYLEENFESFDLGTVDTDVAKDHGYTYSVASDAPNLKVEYKDGSQVLALAAKRPYLYMGDVAAGAYTLTFDVKSDAKGTSSGLYEVWIATVSGGTVRFRLWDNGAFGIIDSTVTSGMNFLMQTGGGFSAGGYNSSRDDAANAKMSAGKWYTVELIVDPATKAITMNAAERDNASGDSWSASKIMPNAFTNSRIQLDGNTAQKTYLDNISCTAIADWDYPITVVQPAEGGSVSVSTSAAPMGTQVTVTANPDAGYALNTIKVKHGSGAYQAIDGSTFVVGTDPVTVTAEFDVLYNVAVGTVIGGTADVNKTQAMAGETVTVTATPDDTTNVAEIKVNGTPIDGNTFRMPAEDVTVTVEFKPDPTERDITVTNVTGGTITVSPARAAVGTTVTVNVDVADGYKVSKVTANGVSASGSNGAYAFTMPAEAVNVTAEYEYLIVMLDNFDTYTVGNFYDGTNKNTAAVAKGYGFSTASGSPVVNVVQDSGNKVLQVTAARPYITIGDPNASFTLKFDVRRDADSTGMLDVWIANQAADTTKTYRFRIQENGAVSLADSKTAYNYYVQTDGTLRQSGKVWLSNRTDENNALMSKNVWYTVELVVTLGSKDIGMKIYERDNASKVLCNVTQTMADTCAHRNVQIDPQAQTSEPTISLDNIDLRKNP